MLFDSVTKYFERVREVFLERASRPIEVNSLTFQSMPPARGQTDNELILNEILEKGYFNHINNSLREAAPKLDVSDMSQDEILGTGRRIDNHGFWGSIVKAGFLDPYLSELSNENKISFGHSCYQDSAKRNLEMRRDGTSEIQVRQEANYFGADDPTLWKTIFLKLDLRGMNEDAVIGLADNSHSPVIWMCTIQKIITENPEYFINLSETALGDLSERIWDSCAIYLGYPPMERGCKRCESSSVSSRWASLSDSLRVRLLDIFHLRATTPVRTPTARGPEFSKQVL